MEADIICSVLVMRCLSERNTCFLSLANVYLAVCGLTWTLQPAFSPVRFRLLSMFHTSPTGNRDSSKNMIERTAVTLFFLPIPFFMIPLYQPQSLNELHDYNWLIKTLSRKCKYPVAQQKRNKGCVLQVEYTVNPEGYISHATVLNQAPRAFRKSVMLVFQSLRNVPTVLRHGKSTLST